MRVTVHIDDQLLRAAEEAAAESGQTIDALIEDTLRQFLAAGGQIAETEFKMPTLNLGTTLPGVDLDNSAGVDERMEEWKRTYGSCAGRELKRHDQGEPEAREPVT
jgi:hypothetical protein